MSRCRKKKEGEQPPAVEKIKLHEIFKYATRKQKIIGTLGFLGGIVAGLTMPCISLIMGDGVAVFDPN
jgi:hypothetical protein